MFYGNKVISSLKKHTNTQISIKQLVMVGFEENSSVCVSEKMESKWWIGFEGRYKKLQLGKILWFYSSIFMGGKKWIEKS